MSDLPFGRLDVQGELDLDVDGVPAHLSATGSRLLLTSAHPDRVWAAAVASALPAGVGVVAGPRAVGRAAEALAAAGLQLRVAGPHGTVVTLGDGVASRLGQVTTGSAAVGPGGPPALALLAWSRWRRQVGGVGVLVGVGALTRWALRRRT